MKKHSFPLWLLCLVLFASLAGIFAVRLPHKMQTAEIVAPGETPSAEDTADTSVGTPEAAPAESETAETAAVEAEVPAEADSAAIPPADAAAPESTKSAEIPDPVPESAEAVIVQDEPAEPPVHIHHFVGGICSECGAGPSFETGYLPDAFYTPSEKAGTVVSHSYTVTAYANHGDGKYEKKLNLYLPWGYDESKQYNVLVLIPGQGGDENSWLTTEYESGGKTMSGKMLFDRMMEQGLCDPCIIVCPRVETNLVQGLTAGIYQMRDELRQDILPWLAENYSTYAADGSLESLQAARAHFGLGGLSNGALFVYEGGMRYNFDLFASYAAFSGNGEPWNTVNYIQSGDWAGLPIDCFFTGAGTEGDWQQNYTRVGFDYFVENDTRLTEGVNAWRVDVEGGHEWKVWLTDMYNALQVMFQSAA